MYTFENIDRKYLCCGQPYRGIEPLDNRLINVLTLNIHTEFAGSPSKSGFQLVDLSDAEAMTSSEAGSGHGSSQGVAGVTFDPSMSVTASPALRTRRDSAGSSVSDASGLFPIYEVPGVSFNMPQVKGGSLHGISV